MKSHYTFEWFDLFIADSREAIEKGSADIGYELYQEITIKLAIESSKAISTIKHNVFGMKNEQELRMFIRNYYLSLVHLFDLANLNHTQQSVINLHRHLLNSVLVDSLRDMIRLILKRFSQYLNLDDRVPFFYKEEKQKQLLAAFGRVNEKWGKDYFPIVKIIEQEMSMVLNDQERFSVSFRLLFYTAKLLDELDALGRNNSGSSIFTVLDQQLVYWNFNSRRYLDNLTQRISEEVNQLEEIKSKLDRLNLLCKQFNQMLFKQGVSLYTENDTIKNVMSNWFTQEIIFLEKKLRSNTVPFSARSESSQLSGTILKKREAFKVMCVLSIDQLALIFRAADEMRVLVARSMAAIYSAIVPFLSTPMKEDISINSIRNKAYNPEERDKQAAIDALKGMIRKIEGY